MSRFTRSEISFLLFATSGTLISIGIGKPIENGYAESFIGRFRDECLNENWFVSLKNARKIIERWRLDYNEHRPHTSLGGLTPTAFMENNGKILTAVGL